MNNQNTLTEGKTLPYEMAKLNLKDGATSLFPANKYRIVVMRDKSPNNPPNMYVNYPSEGWEIKVFIESGDLWQVVSYGNRKCGDKFSDIIKMIKDWFQLETLMPRRTGTNQQAALDEWEANNTF